MKNTWTMKHITKLFVCLLFSGCVSVNFKSEPPKKSENMIFVSPSSAYQKVSSVHLDHSWQNSSNGATISVLSECQNSTDPTLENIFRGITSELNRVDVIESHRVDYNSRVALHAQVEGDVDGVLTRFELMIFKKNSCMYILTYAATANAFASGQKEFRNFVKGFVVP